MERHLLVTVSEKHDNLFGVRFVGNFFKNHHDMKITLFYLTPKPPGRFESNAETQLQIQKTEAVGRKALNDAKTELLKFGFNEENIFVKIRARRLPKVNEIIQEGSEGRYDAVVLGRRGLSWLEHTFDESVTRLLFEETWDFPIWLCRRPDDKRKHLLACVDGSEASNRMLDHVGFMLGPDESQNITLLAVSKAGNVGESTVDDLLSESKTLLEKVGLSSDRVHYKVIPEANAGKAILKEATSERFAAVAVGRTGKEMGFFKKMLEGSVSRTLFQSLEGASLWLA